MERVLFWMCMNYEYNELIEPELESLAERFGIKPEEFRLSHHIEDDGAPPSPFDQDGYYVKFTDYYKALLNGDDIDDKRVPKSQQNVFYYGNVPSMEVAIKIFERCVQGKSLIRVWSEGQTYADVLEDIKKNHEQDIVEKLVDKRWCVKFKCFNSKTEPSRLVSILNEMSEVFDRAGDVDIKNPNTKIAIIERYNDYTTKKLCNIYIGECIREKDDLDTWWDHYSLSKRPILAPTTLENMLAFIMINLGMVTKGSVVLDPFVGSAGSLISASHFGALCFGSDIDMRVLKGWSVGHHNRNLPPSDLPTHVFTNFKHYNLPFPEMLRFDNRHTVWKSLLGSEEVGSEWVDVIVADPPYGIRASAKNRKLLAEDPEGEVVNCLINTLLDMSETMLVPEGRLVFLLPTKNHSMQKSLQILKRPKLEVKYIGLQQLTAGNK
ncbi:RNA methylase-like protein [Babesia gibsoni]|uniref:RNA methylase-like protein n=1 Tax=Babesia gibsoni TaxID=33632 RepID=A0AAD8PDC9_BABGI|nr:RNA methylase-like protein [Babesia gibsoni]